MMFQPNTVVVIGAGASCEFSLPAGDGLKINIAGKLDIQFENGWQQTSGDPEIYETLKYYANNKKERVDEYLLACQKIKSAMPQALSIDNFLDAHQEDDKINFCGKLAIAKCIIEAERQSILMKPPRQPKIEPSAYASTWLIPFAQRLTEGYKATHIDNVFDNISFICFNYDRCLELSLSYILQNYYFIDRNKASALVSDAKIFHPYGSLGRLPWQMQSSSGVTCEFGEELRGSRLIEIALQIKTFTERVSDENLLTNLRGHYASATRLIFLGFGFHDLNMELLTSISGEQQPDVFGTATGLSISDQLLAQQVVRRSLANATISNMNIVPLTCAQIFRDFGRAMCIRR